MAAAISAFGYAATIASSELTEAVATPKHSQPFETAWF
jgi:hypothetical protein